MPGQLECESVLTTCVYADSTNNEKLEIGTYFAREHAKRRRVDPRSVVLSTCQRIELYRYGEVGERLPIDGLVVSDPILGRRSCMIRVAEIAAGVRSQIIGEKFIYRQVQQVFMDADAPPALREMGLRALQVAQDVRRAFKLIAHVDYDDIVMRLLSAQRQPDQHTDLLVFGGGMMGQAIARNPATSSYRKVYIVTRSPKRARRQLPQTATPIRLTDIASLPLGSCDVVIATAEPVPGTEEIICDLLRSCADCHVVDISASGIGGSVCGMPSYTSMYSPSFTSMVQDVNSTYLTSIEAIHYAIRQQVDQVL